MGFDELCRWVEWDKVALGVFFPIRVGFDGLWDGPTRTDKASYRVAFSLVRHLLLLSSTSSSSSFSSPSSCTTHSSSSSPPIFPMDSLGTIVTCGKGMLFSKALLAICFNSSADSPVWSTSSFRIDFSLHNSRCGLSNSATFPASRTRMRSESMTVCSRCATVNVVHPRNLERIVR